MNQQLLDEAGRHYKGLGESLRKLADLPDGVPVELTQAFSLLVLVGKQVENAADWHNAESPDKVIMSDDWSG